MDLTKYIFVTGVELSDNTLIFAVENSEFSKTPHTLFLFRSPEGKWTQPAHLPWPPSGVSSNADGTGIFSISPMGKVVDLKKDSHSNIAIYKDKQRKTQFRFSKSIDNIMYAGGTNHFLFQLLESEWCEMSNDEMKMKSIDVKAPQCFENITGFNQQELYVFGWRGILWTNALGEWQKVASPTKYILNDGDVHNEHVYIGGQLGTILKGRNNKWEIIENNLCRDDIWSVRTFGDSVYFSTVSGIFRLKNDELTVFKELGPDMRTTMNLFVGPSGLWSVGSSDIVLYNGEKWKSIEQSSN